MSGIMMGAAIGRNIHDMMAGNKGNKQPQGRTMAKGQVQVMPAMAVEEFALISKVPGRRRYRMAALVNNAPLAVLLEKQLIRAKDISTVKANPATGSLLLTYQAAESVIDELAEGIRLRVATVNGVEPAQTEAGCSAAADTKLPPTLYAKSWRGTGSFMNNHVRSLTSGWFDISTLLSLFFLVRGIRRMLIYGDRPNGPAMIWWALHLMKGWKG